MYRRSLGSRMRSETCRGVSKWSRHKDQYIGRLYSDFGKVPSDSGIFWSTGELREFAGEKYWALLGHTGIEERGQKEGGARNPSGPNWTRGAAPFSFSLSPSFLLSYSGKERGILLGLGSPSRTPHTWHAPSRAVLLLPPLYTGAGAPHGHTS